MRRLLPLMFLCVACSTTNPGPASEAPEAVRDLRIHVVRLEHANAETTAQVLVEVLGGRPGGPGDLRVVAQPQQNAVVLSGTAQQIREALELVARLDVPSGS
jgi:type II secretory pathway component GspD/PulD (secretin)